MREKKKLRFDNNRSYNKDGVTGIVVGLPPVEEEKDSGGTAEAH